MNKKLLLLCLLSTAKIFAVDACEQQNAALVMQMGRLAIENDTLKKIVSSNTAMFKQIGKNSWNNTIYPTLASGAQACTSSIVEMYKQNPSAFVGWSVAATLITYQFGPSIWKWLKDNYRKDVTKETIETQKEKSQEKRWTGLFKILNCVPFLG